MPEGRTVVVVVVDYDGGEMTLACLRALAATRWGGRLRIVVVDNASEHPLDPVEVRALGAEPVAAPRNLGFAGGVNLGLRYVGTGGPDGPALVALVNNDAFVSPDWLEPLVAALDADRGVGVAQPKLVFEPTFAPVRVAAPLRPQPRGPAQGVWVQGPPGTVFGTGFEAVQPGEWWTTQPEATVYVPAGAGARTARLVLAAPASGEVEVGDRRAVLSAGRQFVEVDVALPPERTSVVQNAGNELTPAGWVRDRGAREPDDGRYDEACDVWGWCGGAAVLRVEYLIDVGWMDEDLFLYWEDVDLSWRGRRRGWRYRYVPTSVVRHRHGASMGALSPRFEALNQRNRLVVLARHAGYGPAARAWARTVAEAVWFAWRDAVRAVPARRRPSLRRSAVRVRALTGAAGLLVRRPGGATGR